MTSTLVCRVERRLPIAVIALYGTLDQSTVARAVVAMRDCLAEAPTVLLADVSHLVVASPASLTRIVALVGESRVWPGARIGFCGNPSEMMALLADYRPDERPYEYPDVDAGVLASLDVPVAQRTSIALKPDAQAPALARQYVVDICTDWGVTRVAKLASLIASELVTNAVVHARTPSLMVLRLTKDTLDLSVRDNDPRPMHRPPPGLTGAHEGEHGRGLLILDAMADEWGCHSTADGKVVWATISIGQ
ncbi:MAG TPA: ATP-binding protein [Micromonosporaceae bacterium]|jgi:anti-sigma regulatory factor (Ser/Thr protein kinase)